MNMGGNSWIIILVYVALFAALYFLLIRPNSKKKKKEQEMRNNIEVGDDITTIGGIQGRIIAVKEDEDAFVIETGPDRTKMKFKKWAISSVDTPSKAPAPAPTKEDKLKELQERREAKKAAKQAAKEEKEAKKNNQ
ncbi:MAG: preprotein translocase subunit YajC [Ruminococcus sp.]|nr:preprotein translocase subunit YajC [Ruminococcus sp.]